MPWVVPLVMAGSAVAGGLMANKASKDAARTAANASKYAADAQSQLTWDMYKQSRMDMDPFRQIGTSEAARAFGYTPSYGGDKSLDPSRYSYNGSAGTPRPQSISFDWESGLSKQGLGNLYSGNASGVQPILGDSSQTGLQITQNLPEKYALGATPQQPIQSGLQITKHLPENYALGATSQQPAQTGLQITQHLPENYALSPGVQPSAAASQAPQQAQQLPDWMRVPETRQYEAHNQNQADNPYQYTPPSQGYSSPAVQPSQQQYAGSGGQTSTVRTVPTYRKTGEGIDPTGGASQYSDRLNMMNPVISTDSTGGAQQWQESLAGMNPYLNADPTGGASKYRDQLDALQFKLDPNDEVYKWRQQQTENAINQAAAARGMYNSRPTINALYDANMALQGNEVDRQFQQNYLAKQNQLQDLYNMSMGIGGAQYGKAAEDYSRNYGQLADQFDMSTRLGGIRYGQVQDNYNRAYGQNMDLFNMTNLMGQQQYGKALDAIKMGQGAASSMGANAMNAGNQLSSIYGNLGNANAQAAIMRGQANADTWQGLGNMPMNYMMMSKLLDTGKVPGSSPLDQYFNF